MRRGLELTTTFSAEVHLAPHDPKSRDVWSRSRTARTLGGGVPAEAEWRVLAVTPDLGQHRRGQRCD